MFIGAVKIIKVTGIYTTKLSQQNKELYLLFKTITIIADIIHLKVIYCISIITTNQF